MKLLPVLSTLGSLVIGGLIAAQAALAAPMQIQVQGTNKCLDKRTGTNEIQIWECGNTPDQVFDIGTAGDPNELYLREPRLCVGHTAGLAKPGNGTRVIVSTDCRYTNSWVIDGNNLSTFKFRDMVMDVTNGNMSNGTRVQMYRRDGSNAQKFVIRPVGGGVSRPTTNQTEIKQNPIQVTGNVDPSKMRLPGGSVSNGISGIQRMTTCFLLGKGIDLPFIPGFSCNQLLSNLSAGTMFQIPGIVPISFEQAQLVCSTFGGRLHQLGSSKMCIKY
jgi:hypothetical protein